MSKVYNWKDGARMRGDAQEVGERLESIRSAHKGNLEPVHIVNDARSKSSPLHRLFEWDNRKAAEQHRLQQARQVICSIEITIQPASGPRSVRAYVSLPDGPGRKYHRITDAMSDDSLREVCVQQALDVFEQAKARYQHFHELGEIFKAIDSTAKRVKQKASA